MHNFVRRSSAHAPIGQCLIAVVAAQQRRPNGSRTQSFVLAEHERSQVFNKFPWRVLRVLRDAATPPRFRYETRTQRTSAAVLAGRTHNKLLDPKWVFAPLSLCPGPFGWCSLFAYATTCAYIPAGKMECAGSRCCDNRGCRMTAFILILCTNAINYLITACVSVMRAK